MNGARHENMTNGESLNSVRFASEKGRFGNRLDSINLLDMVSFFPEFPDLSGMSPESDLESSTSIYNRSWEYG